MNMGTGTKKLRCLGLKSQNDLLALVAVDDQTFDQYYDMLCENLKNNTLFSVELDFDTFRTICDSGMEPRFLSVLKSFETYKVIKIGEDLQKV